MFEKTKIKEKEAGDCPFFFKKNNINLGHPTLTCIWLYTQWRLFQFYLISILKIHPCTQVLRESSCPQLIDLDDAKPPRGVAASEKCFRTKGHVLDLAKWMGQPLRQQGPCKRLKPFCIVLSPISNPLTLSKRRRRKRGRGDCQNGKKPFFYFEQFCFKKIFGAQQIRNEVFFAFDCHVQTVRDCRKNDYVWDDAAYYCWITIYLCYKTHCCMLRHAKT